MREILFRGKRISNKKWVEGYYIHHPFHDNGYQDGIYVPPLTSDDSEMTLAVISETVGEYTGLADKDGKKIFEGDVVNYNNRLYVVKYISQYCRFGGVNKHTVCAVFNFAKSGVVGNIYDNPELLEESEGLCQHQS